MAKIKLKSLIESLVRKTLQENYSAEQNIRDLIDYAGDDTKMLRAIESILKNTKMQELLKDTLEDTEMQNLLKGILESPETITMALRSIGTELGDSEDSESMSSRSVSSRDFGLNSRLDARTGVRSPGR
jgi:hypothetical protein